jgi:nicotinate-nucleotide adenylyltransferase
MQNNPQGIAKPRYGIFGGTFDPVHIGHLILAQESLIQLGLDYVIWVLTPHSPHKDFNRITDIQVRLKLLKAALQDNPKFEISFVDVHRPPPHYAVDSLRKMREDFPASQFIYLIGGDSLRDLPSWHNPKQLLLLIDELGVMRRPGDAIDLNKLEAELPGIQAKIKWIDAPQFDISSSLVRSKIRSGQSGRYYLHPRVYQIICDLSLYQSDST